jgi:hypothetical protein
MDNSINSDLDNIIQSIINDFQINSVSQFYEEEEKLLLLKQWDESRRIVRDEIHQNLSVEVKYSYCDLLVEHLIVLFDPENSLENNINRLNVFFLVTELLDDGNLYKFLYLLKYNINEKIVVFRALDKLRKMLNNWHCSDLESEIFIQSLQSQAFAWALMAKYYSEEADRLAADPDYCIDYFPGGLGPFDHLAISYRDLLESIRDLLESIDSSPNVIQEFKPYYKSEIIIEYIENEKALNPKSIESHYRRMEEFLFYLNMNQIFSPVRKIAIAERLFTSITVIEP